MAKSGCFHIFSSWNIYHLTNFNVTKIPIERRNHTLHSWTKKYVLKVTIIEWSKVRFYCKLGHLGVKNPYLREWWNRITVREPVLTILRTRGHLMSRKNGWFLMSFAPNWEPSRFVGSLIRRFRINIFASRLTCNLVSSVIDFTQAPSKPR